MLPFVIVFKIKPVVLYSFLALLGAISATLGVSYIWDHIISLIRYYWKKYRTDKKTPTEHP